MRRILFWATFIPLGLTLIVLGLLLVPTQIYRGCLFVYMELLDRFERWCFYDQFTGQEHDSLWEAFKEGFAE